MIKNFNTFNNINDYFKIIKKFNLEYYFGCLLKYNSANNAPYHNAYHTLCVMRNAYDICVEDYAFKFEDIQTLLIACLFHDFNHSAGKLNDEENVKLAIESYLKLNIDKTMYIDPYRSPIVNLIKATQYPYIDITYTDNINKRMSYIIRDADMMQIFADNYFQQNIISLGVEFNKSILESAESSLSFLKALKFNTDWANKLYSEAVESKINDVYFMIECINKVNI